MLSTVAMGGMVAGTGVTAMAQDAVVPSAKAAVTGTIQGSTPSNTTMDLFDYWLTEQGNRDDNENDADTLTSGINADDHYLKFLRRSWGAEGGNIGGSKPINGSLNAWTGKSTNGQGGPFSRIVANELVDGYPQLESGLYYRGQSTDTSNANRFNTDPRYTTKNQSLSYLFDPAQCSQASGCAAYKGVTGLLRDGGGGVYTYDSQKNFASFNQTSNSFTLYSQPAVNANYDVADQQNGQFFPFNTAEQVFAGNGVYSTDSQMNHYFGLHMQSTFTQPAGGKVNGQDMRFAFSGDDDVWVFIDGKLVGDLGGMHDRLTLSINFATGQVTVQNGASYDSSTVYAQQQLGDLLGLGPGTATLSPGSEHTLDFFYLERGNGNSNMKLETNLVYHPANELIKIDQAGNKIPGVRFDLYQADENYGITDNTPAASGTTDSNGQFTFKNSADNNKLLTLAELFGKSHYYVLREATIPAGYRATGDVHLQLQQDRQGNVYAVSANKFQTGTIAVPRVETTITAQTITGENNGVQQSVTDSMLQNGTMVAVAMRFNSQSCRNVEEQKQCWKAVIGDAEDGWTENGEGFAGVLKAAQTNYQTHGGSYNAFVLNDNNQWSVNVDDLPGEVGEYYYAATDEADVNYAIGYYYIPNNVLHDQNSTDTSGMYRLISDGYDRQYASVIHVPNIKNVLVVQKTDEDGNAIKSSGGADDLKATFALYADENGKPAQQPMSTKQTTDQKVADDRLGLEGAVSFPSDAADTSAVLETGKTYWVKETAAPKGYVLNEHWVKVVVDVNGVHADATGYVQQADGTMTQVKSGNVDNIAVNVGVGTLVRTMTQWAGDGGDDPLEFINGIKQNGTVGADGALTWNDAPTTEESLKHFQYGYGDADDVPLLKYGYFVVDKDWNRYEHQALLETTFASEDGFLDVRMTPCPAKSVTPGECNAPDYLTDATSLFTGSTIIRVADAAVDARVRIQLNKQVKGADWTGNNADGVAKNFTFTLIRTDDGQADVTFSNASAAPIKLMKCSVAGGLDWSSCATADSNANDTAKRLDAHTSGEIKQDATQAVGLQNDGKATAGALPELTFTKAGTYKFLLKEDTADAERGWKYDVTDLNGTGGYVVTVTINADDATGALHAVTTYGNASGDDTDGDGVVGAIPTFVNEYVPPVSALPLTGGMDARAWLLAGGIAAVAAAITLALINEYRKRKGLA